MTNLANTLTSGKFLFFNRFIWIPISRPSISQKPRQLFPLDLSPSNFTPDISNSRFLEPIFVSLGGSGNRDSTAYCINLIFTSFFLHVEPGYMHTGLIRGLIAKNGAHFKKTQMRFIWRFYYFLPPSWFRNEKSDGLENILLLFSL